MLELMLACGSRSDFPSIALLSRLIDEEEKEGLKMHNNIEKGEHMEIHGKNEMHRNIEKGEGDVPLLLRPPPASMLGLVTRCASPGNDLPALRLLERLLSEEAEPTTNGTSTLIPTSTNTLSSREATRDVKDVGVAPRCPVSSEKVDESPIRDSACTVMDRSATEVHEDSHMKQKLHERGQHQQQQLEEKENGDAEATVTCTASIKKERRSHESSVRANDFQNDIDAPLLEPTILLSPCGTTHSRRNTRDSKIRTKWSSSLPRSPFSRSKYAPHDTGSATSEHFAGSPLRIQSAPAADSTGHNSRVLYAKRYLEKLYFRDPVVVRPASDIPRFASRGRITQGKSSFERCYYDSVGFPFVSLPRRGSATISPAEKDQRLQASPIMNTSGVRRNRSRTSYDNGLSHVGVPSGQQRTASPSSYKTQMRRVSPSGRSKTPCLKAPQQEQPIHDAMTGGLCIEGRALMVCSRHPPSALVRHLRHRKMLPWA